MIDLAQVEYIADLARLNVRPEEKKAFAQQLSAVLDYMEQLNAVDTDHIEPTSYVVPEHDPYRDDVPRGTLDSQRVFQNAPSVKKNYFAIPKVIG